MNSFKENKKFLMQYRITQQKINELEDELVKLDDQSHVQSQKLTGMPSSESSDDYDALIVHKTTVEDKINSLNIIAREQFKNILEVILKLNNKNQRDILELYFLYRHDLNEIASRINMSCRNVERLYSQGIRNCR